MTLHNTITVPNFDEFNGEVYTQVITPVQDIVFEGANAAQRIIFDSAWLGLFGFSLIISLILATISIYSMLRIRQIRKKENEYYARQPLSSVARRVFDMDDTTTEGSAHRLRWRDVLRHVSSENKNDWRQAILEADVMLDDVITSRGYSGESLGEKMKQVKRNDINSIEEAWEAHKYRNRVAHEGSSFDLTHRDVKRVIGLYEKVFKELGYKLD